MQSDSGPVSGLSVLGLTTGDEELYRALLRNPGVTMDHLSEMLGDRLAVTRERVAPLVAAGLVTVDGGTVTPVAPDKALGGLIAEESERLHRTVQQLESLRDLLPSLMGEHLSSQSRHSTPVDVHAVEGGNVTEIIRGLAGTSPGDLLWLRPDQWRLTVGAENDRWVREQLESGRRSRAIYPARVLEEAPDVVRSRAEAGEHVRILAHVPSRLSIIGTRAALMPERWGRNTGRRLVVREESIVAALVALFDVMWERAMSVPGMEGQSEKPAKAGGRRLLLDQLAAGAKDEQIARDLGLSLRTVRRRVAEILDELGADSRFQAGVEAVRRGWI